MADLGSTSKCETEGFVARSSGAERESNPYNLILRPDVRPWLQKVQRDMSAAWWQGWDRAHRHLSGGRVPAIRLSLEIMEWPTRNR